MTGQGDVKAAAAIEPGTLHQLPPGSLLLQRNIRDAQPSKDLVESVRSVGVLVPVTAVLTDAGEVLVRSGHRRVLAAIAAERPDVPVYVVGADALDDQAEVARIIAQRDENTHRSGLTASDEIGVVEQLAAFGLSADQIAEQGRMKKDRVATALSVSKSALARKSTTRHADITLDQAAAVAEFEADTDTAKSLILTAVQEPTQFAHALQLARDDRDEKAAQLRAIEVLTEAGVDVVERPTYDAKTKALHRLVDAKTGKGITEKGHAKCPGRVAWLQQSWTWVDADGNPTSGRDGVRQVRSFVAEYGCSDPAANGHRDQYASGSSGSGKTPAAELPEAEREAAKKARRLVIDNNKAWDSAQVVRREWLAEFAKRKTAPKGTGAFLSDALSVDAHVLSGDGTHSARAALCTEWGLSTTRAGYRERIAVPAGASEGRALVIALTQVLASYEVVMDRMDWRRNGKTERHGRYLAFLQACDYGLSDVEKFALSSKTVQ